MPKLIAALWGAAAVLHDPALHVQLAAAGATRLQVNVDDEAVADAMRIPTAEPVTGFASTWDGDAVAALTALTDAVGPGGRVAAWEVEERRPIEPPEAWDGTRTDALANIAVLRRPAELSPEEWRHRWLVDHTPVAIATQGTFGYLQHPVVRPLTEDAPRVDAIVEELFPMAGMLDPHAFFGSGDDADLADRMERLMASVARFGADREIDLVPTSRYLYRL